MVQTLIVLALLAVPVEERPPLPLMEGFRWKYQLNGRYAIDMVVLDPMTIRDAETTTVRRGVDSSGFAIGEVFWSAASGYLLKHADRLQDTIFVDDPPLVLLKPPLAVGQAWVSQTWHPKSECGSGFRAEVLARETVLVPAGTFEAWKIGYTHTFHLGTMNDTNMWFTPGVGFVKVELWQKSAGWRGPYKTPLKKPIVYELAAFGPKPVVSYPTLTQVQRERAEQLIDRLGNNDPQVVEQARQELLSLECAVLPLLFERVDNGHEPVAQAHVRTLIEHFGSLSVVGHARKNRIRLGEALPVEFRIRNDFPIPVRVLPSLDASDLPRCLSCYPRYVIEIRNDSGDPIEVDPPIGCGNIDPLLSRNFVELQPGEEMDPFRGAVPYMVGVDPPEQLDPAYARPWLRHYTLRWGPAKPGKYTIRCIYDVSGKVPDEWYRFRFGHGGFGPELVRLLKNMPRGRFESNSITVEVGY